MDQTRFDTLTRALGGASTRRAGLKAALGGLLGLGSGIAALPDREGAAKKGKKKKRTLCPAVCPSGAACVDGACTCTRPLCGGYCCASDRTACENDRCVYTGLRDCSAVKIVDGADLSFCNFRGKAIPNRTLRNANFTGADLTDARFTGQFQPWGCSFRGARLVGADLDECDIKPGTTFLRADLTGATFTDGHIDGADFSGADLSGAQLKWMTVNGASFVEANLGGAKLGPGTFTDVDFSRADLSRANLVNTNSAGSGSTSYTRCRFADAVLTGCSLNNKVEVRASDFAGATLSGAAFWRAFFRSTSFARASLTGADLSSAQFNGCGLEDADLTGSKFSAYGGDPTNGITAFIDCGMDRAVVAPKPGVAARFERTSLRGATLEAMSPWNLSFVTVDLTGATGPVPGPDGTERWCWNLLPDGTRSSRAWCTCPAGPDACWPLA